MHIWDGVTGHDPGPPLHPAGLRTVSYSPDGRIIAAGDYNGYIYWWYAETCRAVSEPLRPGPSDRLIDTHSIGFSPDGTRIISGTADGRIKVWEVSTAQQLLVFKGHNHSIRSVRFSSDGRFICSGSDDNTVRLWDSSTGMPVALMNGHTKWVMSVAITLDGRYIVSGSYDNTIRIWDVEAGRGVFSKSDTNSSVSLRSSTLRDYWLVGPSDELLLWVPAEYCSYLQILPCTMVIGKHRVSVSIGDSGWHHGENWTSCWLGEVHSNVSSNV